MMLDEYLLLIPICVSFWLVLDVTTYVLKKVVHIFRDISK